MKKICIFGSGKLGKILKKCLDYNVVELVAYIDNHISGEMDGAPIFAPEQFEFAKVDYVIVSSRDYYVEMSYQLKRVGVSEDKIISAFFREEEMPVIMDIFSEKGLNYIHFYKHQLVQKRIEEKVDAISGFINKRYNNLYLKNYAEHNAAKFIYEKFVMDESVSRNVVFENRKQYRDFLLTKLKDKEGLFLEFGVYQGKSINYMANELKDKVIYGFDSFEGLPENWLPNYRKGMFDLEGNMPNVLDNVTLIKGWFDESLPSFVLEHKEDKCAYINIDCDLYSSTKVVLDCLKDKIVKGTIISFDEYVGQIGWELDEYKAFNEWLEKNNMQYRYIACAFGGGSQLTVSVAIEIV